MIVHIEKGSSFLGAALYYFHDKRDPHELLRTSDRRVAWTHVENCASNDAQLAIYEMIAVAEAQQELKRQAGRGLGGRDCDEPVMTVSLSWHPTEKPRKEHMIETAREYLQHMGYGEHQAAFVAHNDTEHQHVHVILNRIHPETGLVHDNYKDFDRASDWRDAYDHQHGKIRDGYFNEQQIRMHHREAIDARDIQHRYEEIERLGAHAIEETERSRAAQPDAAKLRFGDIEPDRYDQLEQTHHQTHLRDERDTLALRHKEEREAFLKTNKQQFRAVRDKAYRETREEYRQLWADHYRQTKDALEFASREAAHFTHEAVEAARRHEFEAAHKLYGHAVVIVDRARDLVAEARQQLAESQRAHARDAQDRGCKELIDQRAKTFDVIKDRQQQDRGELRGMQTARDHGDAYSHKRLEELLRPREGPHPEPYRPYSDGPPHAEAKQAPELETTAQQAKEAEVEAVHDAPAAHDKPERAPNRDGFDGIAGGIAKIAEVVGKVMEALLVPETPRQKAGREAEARADAAAAPEREAAAEARELAQRQSAHEQRMTAQERYQAYWNEHGGRLREESAAREKKKRDERER